MRVDDIISGERNTCFIGHIQNQISGVFSLCLWYTRKYNKWSSPILYEFIELQFEIIVDCFKLCYFGFQRFNSFLYFFIYKFRYLVLNTQFNRSGSSSPMVTWWVINGLFAVGSVRDSERSSWDTGVDVAIIWVPGTDSSLDFWGFSRHPKKIWTYHWDSFYFCFSGHFGSNVNVITQWYKYI